MSLYATDLQVGDRVRKTTRYAWRLEPELIGRVVKVYRGLSGGVQPGLLLADVEWDLTHHVTLGHIVASGSLEPVVLLPPLVIPGVH